MTTNPPAGNRPEDQLVITRQDATGDGVTLALEGDLDPFTAPLLTAELDEVLDDGIRTLALDLSKLRFLDSSGLRVLVMAHNQVQPNGGRVVLRGATDTTRRVLEISGLDSSFVLEP